MIQQINEFPELLLRGIRTSIEQINSADLYADNIVIVGMGGSGISARYAKSLFPTSIPIEIVSSYSIPEYVNNVSSKTLVIISSYSGNTEEVLSCYEQIDKENSVVIAISSGGKLMELPVNYKFELPLGYQPRAAMPYSIGILHSILTKVFDATLLDKFEQFHNFLEVNSDNVIDSLDKSVLQHCARHIVDNLLKSNDMLIENTAIILYVPDYLEALGLRFKQQLNENSKMNAWLSVVPEITHNEMISINTEVSDNRFTHIILDNDLGLASNVKGVQNAKRLDFINKTLVGNECSVINVKDLIYDFIDDYSPNVHVKPFQLTWITYTMILDYVSVLLAYEQSDVDPVEVNVIEHLKNSLK